MATLRIAAITDIHYGLDIDKRQTGGLVKASKLGSKAPRLMEKFIKAVNHRMPDFVVDMGDRVSATDPETDAGFDKELRGYFNRIAAPSHHLDGNHDIKYQPGNPKGSYSQDINGYHIIFWNPAFHYEEDGLVLLDDDIEWFRNDLAAAAGKPALVFSHVPLDNLGDEAHDPVQKYFYWSQGKKIRQIMEDAGNVILCMGGHQHRNRHREINGIHYITQQSLTSVWREKYRIPSGTYSFIEIEDGKIRFDLHGKFKKTLELDARAVTPAAAKPAAAPPELAA